jgi:hypothetical protein
MTTITLKELVRTTIADMERSIEANGEASGDEAALSELKHAVVRSVAELDVEREQKLDGGLQKKATRVRKRFAPRSYQPA